MKFRLTSFLFLISAFIILHQPLSALQRMVDPKDLAVAFWATVDKSVPSITLHWKLTDQTKQFQIAKKGPEELSWSNPIATLDSTATSFTDTDIQIGNAYEYSITALCVGGVKVTMSDGKGGTKDTNVDLSYLGTGYLVTGIESQPTDSYGRVILMIDSTVEESLPDEITRLEEDLVAEGWGVSRLYVPRSEKFDSANVINNKQKIMAEYAKDPDNLKAIFIIGRVAVPYSGLFNQGAAWLDAHQDHRGAWPADLYYGFLNEAYWTDVSAFDTSASRKENHQVPGDGKFDLSVFTSGNVDLMVGRVDFYNMPAFTNATDPKYKKSETELIKQYLDKDHNYRTGQTPVIYRGVISDNFGIYGNEGFAASGWRSMYPLLGPDSVQAGSLFTTLANDNYIWAYGCGGGWYQGASGVGNSADFAQKPFNATFTLLFGSYFGDWDSQDNFIRASLASSPSVLTCGWSGRPQWYMHHMGFGYPVGYSARLSQNNYTTYLPNAYYYSTQPQIVAAGIKSTATALHGDPTLRMYGGGKTFIAPPENVSVIQPPGGYIEVTFDASADAEVAGYNIYRSTEKNGVYQKLNDKMLTGERKYVDTNLYEGSLYYKVRAVKLRKTPTGSFYDMSRGIEKLILATGVNDNIAGEFSFKVSPNPATDHADITLGLNSTARVSLGIYDINGNLVRSLISRELNRGSQDIGWNLRDNSGSRVTPGVYLVKLTAGQKVYVEKIVILP